MTTVLRIAAFSDGNRGGNPAGVWIGDVLPDASTMQAMAADVGFSETAFAAPKRDAWRVRYYSPLMEVPFCGHATIAMGAALAHRYGDRTFQLNLKDAVISVTGRRDGTTIAAALQSPPTRSGPIDPSLGDALLDLFGYAISDLDVNIPPARIHGGADHVVLALQSRDALARMTYDFERGRALMGKTGLVTVALVTVEHPQLFHARNAFAAGGVVEDPATGAAAAALAGYLRDIGWPHGGVIDIVQGEDMGLRSLIRAEIGETAGSSIRVSGTARFMDDACLAHSSVRRPRRSRP
jgi:PhzF family phenazine biosynthesis protein